MVLRFVHLSLTEVFSRDRWLPSSPVIPSQPHGQLHLCRSVVLQSPEREPLHLRIPVRISEDYLVEGSLLQVVVFPNYF